MKKAWVLSYPLSAQRRLRSDWADAQAYLSLRWTQTYFVGFVMSWLKCSYMLITLFVYDSLIKELEQTLKLCHGTFSLDTSQASFITLCHVLVFYKTQRNQLSNPKWCLLLGKMNCVSIASSPLNRTRIIITRSTGTL